MQSLGGQWGIYVQLSNLVQNRRPADLGKPTNGRQVWYIAPHEAISDASEGQPLASTVCHVHHDRLVNLQVLDAPWQRSSPHLDHAGPGRRRRTRRLPCGVDAVSTRDRLD
jgi:hypothetical protein